MSDHGLVESPAVRFGSIDRRARDADPSATSHGIRVSERSLIPADGAMVGEIRLDDWLREAKVAPAMATAG